MSNKSTDELRPLDIEEDDPFASDDTADAPERIIHPTSDKPTEELRRGDIEGGDPSPAKSTEELGRGVFEGGVPFSRDDADEPKRTDPPPVAEYESGLPEHIEPHTTKIAERGSGPPPPAPAQGLSRRSNFGPATNMPSFLRSKWCFAFAFVCVCVAIGVLAFSLKKVPSTEMGVQYNVHKKQLDDAAKSGGLFVGPPGFRFVKFPSTYIPVDFNDRTCVSNDGLLVKFSVNFQYQMTASNVYPAIVKYRDFHTWASTVEQAALSAIHHSCSEFQVLEFQNKRGVIQSTMARNLKAKLEGDESEEGVNAVSVSLQLTYIQLPGEYNAAVAQKQEAEEDIALAIAQREQETTKASTEYLKAKEEARKIKDTANNEAEVLLTEARLKAEATIYSFQKEAAALVAVKDSLNLTTEGVLAYLSNRLLAEAETLTVATREPAKLSQIDEL